MEIVEELPAACIKRKNIITPMFLESARPIFAPTKS